MNSLFLPGLKVSISFTSTLFTPFLSDIWQISELVRWTHHLTCDCFYILGGRSIPEHSPYQLCQTIQHHPHTCHFDRVTDAAAAKSLQSCPTLCDPTDGSPPGSPVPRILQARTLEWVAISFSSAWKWKVKGRSLSHARPLATPWTAAYRTPPSMGFSRQEYWSGVPLPSPRVTDTTLFLLITFLSFQW